MNRKHTSELLAELKEDGSFEQYVKRNEEEFEEQEFCEYLRKLCTSLGKVPEQVIKNSQIDRTYGHQLFSGRRKPSRDKVLLLSFGMELPFEETQELLRASGKNTLYPKIKRDAAIIYGKNKGLTVLEMQELLFSLDLPILGE